MNSESGPRRTTRGRAALLRGGSECGTRWRGYSGGSWGVETSRRPTIQTRTTRIELVGFLAALKLSQNGQRLACCVKFIELSCLGGRTTSWRDLLAPIFSRNGCVPAEMGLPAAPARGADCTGARPQSWFYIPQRCRRTPWTAGGIASYAKRSPNLIPREFGARRT